MFDLTEVLNTKNQLDSRICFLVEKFVSKENDVTRFLLGRNEHSASLAQLFDIDGFVDDFSADGAFWKGKPVIKTETLPDNAIVVNCSMSISPVTASRKLQQLKLIKGGWLNYSDLLALKPELIPAPAFVAEMRKDVAENQAHWTSLLEKLADKESVKVFNDLVSYRLTADPTHMVEYSTRLSDQYFEDFLMLSNEVFVDAGGFDGDTTEEFCKRYPTYKKVILFEPSDRNMQNAKKRLVNRRDIEFFTLGISDICGTLSFNPDAGSASAVSNEGTFSIEVTTLDVAVKEKNTFIKMDLEGWELKALQGSKQHILDDHPKLAISVYHSASDFWCIPEYIFSLRQDYDIYLRHYTEGWSETIMFFVPKKEITLNKIGGLYYWENFLKQKDIPISLFDSTKISSYEEQVALFKKYVCIVNVETSIYCNRVCSYCPVSTDDYRKTQEQMHDVTYNKIIQELKSISYASTVALNLYNEPLADEKIYRRVKQARENLPDAFLMFNSNGDYINKDKLNRLNDAGLNAIFVTLHTSPKQSYELNDRIKCFHKLFRKLGIINYEIDKSSKDGNIESNVDWNGMRLRVMANNWEKYGNSRAGSLEFLNTEAKRTSPCVRPLRELTISHDGSVLPCCQFYPESSKKYVVGDVGSSSIFEIYSSLAMARWRKDLFTFSEKKSPCDTCRDEDFSTIDSIKQRRSIIDNV